MVERIKVMRSLVDIANEQNKPPIQVVVDALNDHPTQGDAARELGVSRTAIRKWIKRFDLRTVYIVPPTNNAQSNES
jgi:DNA-binding protein Fis